jgi:hypothetical protein
MKAHVTTFALARICPAATQCCVWTYKRKQNTELDTVLCLFLEFIYKFLWECTVTQRNNLRLSSS